MSEYYGLINVTKKEKISSHWKKHPSLYELKQIAILRQWDLSKDNIISGSYYSLFTYQNNTWEEIEHIDHDFDSDDMIGYGVKYICAGRCLELNKQYYNGAFFFN